MAHAEEIVSILENAGFPQHGSLPTWLSCADCGNREDKLDLSHRERVMPGRGRVGQPVMIFGRPSVEEVSRWLLRHHFCAERVAAARRGNWSLS